MRTSVLVADDHPLVLRGLASLIGGNAAFEVVDLCENGTQALERIREVRPDIAILDVNMPGMDGIQVLSSLGDDGAKTNVILLTAGASDAQFFDAVTMGAAGLVIKDAALDMLMTCLEAVARGERWLPAEVLQVVDGREKRRRDKWTELSPALTARELEIVRLTVEGHSVKNVAFMLQITYGTCKVHLNNIFRKLDVSSRQELRTLAEGQV